MPDEDLLRKMLFKPREFGTNFVILDKCPTAYAYLKSCDEFGEELVPTVLSTDYHMLGCVDMIQDHFNQDNVRKMLGKW